MEIILEKNLKTDLYPEYLWELNTIIQLILNSKNETELRNAFKCETFKEFLTGFGGHHFWVHEKHSSSRMLMVKF